MRESERTGEISRVREEAEFVISFRFDLPANQGAGGESGWLIEAALKVASWFVFERSMGNGKGKRKVFSPRDPHANICST